MVAVVLIWLKRATSPLKPDPHVHPRLELWMDLLRLLMVCTWGAWLILFFERWDDSLTSYIEATRLMAHYGLTSEDELAYVQTEWRKGISLDHVALMLFALPVYVALKRRQDAHLRESV